MELIFTKDEKWLAKWDAFIVENPKGSHLILSDWIKSYKSYGFDFEVGLFLKDDKIIGGFAAVIPKVLFFKFYIIPHGLIYQSGYETHFEGHCKSIKNRAMKRGCCYLQLSVPISSQPIIKSHVYHPNEVKFLKTIFNEGKLFGYVYSSYGINWVDFKGFSEPENLLEQLTPKVRRNVRMPYNKNAKANFVTELSEIKKGYEVIVENARQANYSVRSFKDFKPTILRLIEKQLAYVVNCKVDGEVKASGIFVRSGGFITNITGGVLRHKPDIKLGYMLQWEIIKESFKLGSKGYNISMGGSHGVQDFKSKFGAETINFESPHYHFILKPFYFKLFRFFDTYLKPYKSKISVVLAKFK
ncbi:peptidoglycan bridge formation glycyltransferase FemA/FemB family protein [Psychroserpens algicola]|uniref:Aminoacyltransferase n=1 Tax=Psychroserpens algicola TaxID=1719034 RepID=A0ABT0H578_9FLAO|nr:peptidoglycan bridge formation glycyltransferase FemA/FemB family protein [Psychroserpens algicola]MCK8479549.1 aminoacyltransferase [Psychroserpens algicola]